VACPAPGLAGKRPRDVPGRHTVRATDAVIGDVSATSIRNDGWFVSPTITPALYTRSVTDAPMHGSPLTLEHNRVLT
jgi:hypothetical protein